MDLSIVIPAYNEARRILGTIDEVTAFCRRALSRWEIIVVDDGSRDGTAALVEGTRDVRVLKNEINRGKGYSVRRGVLEATVDPVLFTDADLSTPIAEALPLFEALHAGSDVAIASRVHSHPKAVRRTLHRRLMGAVFRLCVRSIAVRGFTDTQCGFKMFRLAAAREIFPRQLLERWGFDAEVLLIARKLGYRVAEVPVAWSESAETRLKWWTPLTMLRDLFEIRWNDLRGRYRT